MKPIWTVALVFFAFACNAQNVRIITQVSNDTVLYGNVVKIKFTAENLQAKFEAPDFGELNVISGPNVSTSMQFVNGKMSSALSYEYVVSPQELGEHFISPAYFESPDTTLETLPVAIMVMPNPDGIRQNNKNYKTIEEQNALLPGESRKKKLKSKKRKI